MTHHFDDTTPAEDALLDAVLGWALYQHGLGRDERFEDWDTVLRPAQYAVILDARRSKSLFFASVLRYALLSGASLETALPDLMGLYSDQSKRVAHLYDAAVQAVANPGPDQ